MEQVKDDELKAFFRDAREILVTVWEQLDLERIRTDTSAIGLDKQLDMLLKTIRKDIEN
jgi:hypothetical protein